MSIELKQGDALAVLKTMESESVHCAITSPPYWGLRDYGIDGQIGLEKTPEEYVSHIVAVMRDVWRVLRDDGTLWLNLGDSYARQSGSDNSKKNTGQQSVLEGNGYKLQSHSSPDGMKPKDLVGIPWMVAFALRADGWYLRSDIIWSKPNPMPESVTDRPTKAHEYVFLLSKSATYYYDADSIKEECAVAPHAPGNKARSGVTMQERHKQGVSTDPSSDPNRVWASDGKRNRRTVWTINTAPYKGAHFATFPPKLIEPMILAACPVGGTVLDMFCGTATVGAVCVQHNRNFIGIELNLKYIELARERIVKAQARDPRYLRECGMSLSEIAKTLKVTVPEVARQLK